MITLAAFVAEGAGAKLLVILTDVDGLYTGPPKKRDSKLVRTVEEVTTEVENWVSRDSKGFGGMYTKIQAAKKLSEEGITTVIANARRRKCSGKSLRDQPELFSSQGEAHMAEVLQKARTAKPPL